MSNTIKTKDGETINLETAMGPNIEVLFDAKNAAAKNGRRELAAAFFQLIGQILANGVQAYVVSSAETVAAKKLAKYVEMTGLKLESDRTIFVSFARAREIALPHLEVRAEQQAKLEIDKAKREATVAAALTKVEAEAKAKAEARAKEREAANELRELVGGEEKTERPQFDTAAKQQRKEWRDEFFGALIRKDGQPLATIVWDRDWRRVSHLSYTTESMGTEHLQVFYKEDIMDMAREQGVTEARDLSFSCQCCGNEWKLGDQQAWKGQGPRPMRTVEVNGEKKQVPVFLARIVQMGIYAIKENGEEWQHRGGPRDGQLRPVFIIVCNTCSGVARNYAPTKTVTYTDKETGQEVKRDKPDLYTKPLIEYFAPYFEEQKALDSGQVRRHTGQFTDEGQAVMETTSPEPVFAASMAETPAGQKLAALAAAADESEGK